MRLRITGTLDDLHVLDADTGQELEGVEEVNWRGKGSKMFRKCEITLKDAAIDISIDASRVEAYTHEDGKFAKSKLLDIARLRWK